MEGHFVEFFFVCYQRVLDDENLNLARVASSLYLTFFFLIQ